MSLSAAGATSSTAARPAAGTDPAAGPAAGTDQAPAAGPAPAGDPFSALRHQLQTAAEAFADGPDTLAGILGGMLDDIDRALGERLEIFPVCHHSPASALAMARRLRQKQPKVIYLELCEDLQPLLTELRNCHLPVALQAYAAEVEGFPPAWAPLSVIAPITESSAEYQAIAYALETPGVELLLVDRSADHVFQWQLRNRLEPDAGTGADQAGPAGTVPVSAGPVGTVPVSAGPVSTGPGDAVGIEIGDLRPRFTELEEHLLRHGRVRHWSEWWDQYVEQPLAGADYQTYRQVMVLIGSLFRRLRPAAGGDERRRLDIERERYMWTRIRQHLAGSGADPAACLYVCGAFHAASPVEQFGAGSTAPFEIAPRTGTEWRYGLIPSSFSAIEAQFGLAPGSVSIASTMWQRAVAGSGTTSYRLVGQKGERREATRRSRRSKTDTAIAGTPTEVTDQLSGFLSRPPQPGALDESELLGWCVEIVHLARRNGYLASTADAIAIFETSVLLAGMRNRHRPTPYDFSDAALTCLEKDVVPGRRDIPRLCEILFGGDRIGKVGYESLPPLARDVHDRLAPLGLDLERRTKHRALLDLADHPELRPCSDLLWILRALLPVEAARPIMGERRLGSRSIQESWDLALGQHQRDLIELGYEGVTVEQVLTQRLRARVWEDRATAGEALAAVEESLLLLANPRLTDELGERAVLLLAAERSADGAPEVLRRVRKLLAHYRATGSALPGWVKTFVTTGYAHYCTLLPTAFAGEDAGVREVAAMLGFLFSMESLALALGCDRTQLELAVAQSHPEPPDKVALLWAARNQLGLLPLSELRERCAELLGSPLTVSAFPHYLSGFVRALDPVPALVPFVVEVISDAFARLPDPVLLPWLPNLITTLRTQGADLVPVLVREAGRIFPADLAALDTWTPPWSAPAAAAPRAASDRGLPSSALAGPVATLLAAHPDGCDALAALLGCDDGWATATVDGAGPIGQAGGGAQPAAAELLDRHPVTAQALHALLYAG